MAESPLKSKEDGSYLAGFHAVKARELAAIRARWTAQKKGDVDEHELVGIAISGGGIRSGSFAIGVLQKLALDGQLDKAHYLSTVSGGGYAGSSLTWFLSQDARYGTKGKDCPFVGGLPGGVRKENRADTNVQSTETAEPTGREITDYIRQRSSYLISGGGFGLLSAIGVVLRSLFVSLLAYATLFTIVGLLLYVPGVKAHAAIIASIAESAGVIVGLLALFAAAYSLVAPLPFGFMRRWAYPLRRGYHELFGWLLGAVLGLLLLALWLFAVWYWPILQPYFWDRELPDAAAASTVGSVVLAFAFRRLCEALPRFSSYLMPLVPPIILLVLLLSLGALGYWAAGQFLALSPNWQIVAGICAVLYLFYANSNLTGLHRFYRDRLMEAFMPDVNRVRLDRPHDPTSADQALLCEMFEADRRGPYHLINANVVLKDGAAARYRSRQSDSFVLAPLYCGSDATGWAETKTWLSEPKPNIIRTVGPMTLPTAMAISGAAVNPNTGTTPSAATRGGALSALLTIFNIRLGYWSPSPSLMGRPNRSRSLWYPPNYIRPGLTHGIFGFGRNERAKWLELTDGGHFDNVGLYELVRRRVQTIYVIDGSEDREITLASFANAAEKAFIDFDVKIEFDKKTSFIDLMRGADVGDDPLNKAYRLAKNGFAIGKIIYPPWSGTDEEFEGKLVYIKSTLTGDLPPALYSYRADNPTYPAQSTLDQFFDEEQFEAYRALGFAVARQYTKHEDAMKAAEEAALRAATPGEGTGAAGRPPPTA